MTSPDRGWVVLTIAALLAAAGCEATQPKQVEDPDPLGLGADMDEVDQEESPPVADRESSGEGEDDALGSGDSAPKFTDNMSVAEAQAAVPRDAERLNMEQDVLAEPLQEESLYAPCKLGEGHFKASVAVWDGRVVGLDVQTQPNNATLAKCLDEQIRKVIWRDKVKSLNTIDFSL